MEVEELLEDKIDRCKAEEPTVEEIVVGGSSRNIHASHSTSHYKQQNLEVEEDIFYFESEQFALKGNEEYRKLLGFLVKLEARNSKTIEDLNLLKQEKCAALQNPQRFLERLKGNNLHFTPPKEVPKVPSVNWHKYRCDESVTKLLKEATEGDGVVKKILIDMNKNFHERRSATKRKQWRPIKGFYSHWTEEEEQRLRDLFQSTPTEMKFSKRIKEIVKCLGNKSFTQVFSKMQRMRQLNKLILNDHEEALISNRILPSATGTSFHGVCDFERFSSLCSSSQPVSSESDSDTDMPDASSEESDVSDEGIDSFFHITPEFKKLMELKKISRINANMERSPLLHISFKCNSCGITPIRGTRWHCIECSGKEIESCDFCDLCKRCFFKRHNRHHNVVQITVEAVNDNQPSTSLR